MSKEDWARLADLEDRLRRAGEYLGEIADVEGHHECPPEGRGEGERTRLEMAEIRDAIRRMAATSLPHDG
jgi:hypothetical protein